MNIVGLIIGILLGALVTGFVIWVVGKLGLGIEVDGFGPAYTAAIVIAILNGVIAWLLGVLNITIGTWILGAVIHLIIAALVLMTAAGWVKGLRAKGFSGALIASVVIAAVGWLIAWGVILLI